MHQWIIWNEQNARNFWRSKPNPKDYATLVKASDKAISEVDANAEIVLGGMYCCPNDDRSYSATNFLRSFYKVKGIERHFDTINVHPYGSGVATVQEADPAAALRRRQGRRQERRHARRRAGLGLRRSLEERGGRRCEGPGQAHARRAQSSS